MTRCFLSTSGIERINLYIASINMYFYFPLVSFLDQSNILKSVLYIEKSTISQQIIFSRRIIIWKKSLIIVISSIGLGQVINKFYNTRLLIIKVLKIVMNMLLSILWIYQSIHIITIYQNLSYWILSQSSFMPFLAS